MGALWFVPRFNIADSLDLRNPFFQILLRFTLGVRHLLAEDHVGCESSPEQRFHSKVRMFRPVLLNGTVAAVPSLFPPVQRLHSGVRDSFPGR